MRHERRRHVQGPGRDDGSGTRRRAAGRGPAASRDLHEDLSFFGATLGFRLDSIFPADDPAVAVMSGHGLRLRLERGAGEAPGAIRLLCDDPDRLRRRRARSGRSQRHPHRDPPRRSCPGDARRPGTPCWCKRSGGRGSWVTGRAGMHYPRPHPGAPGRQCHRSRTSASRTAGRCRTWCTTTLPCFSSSSATRGWVRVVYEDQGPPFELGAGDCVIQPPEIRHRVLESSANAEVIELAAPARHPTMIDHALTLPTAVRRPERDFGGQRFCRHRRTDAVWRGWRLPGFEACGTGIAAATGGVADAQVARCAGSTTRWWRRCRPGDEPR